MKAEALYFLTAAQLAQLRPSMPTPAFVALVESWFPLAGWAWRIMGTAIVVLGPQRPTSAA